MSEQTDRERSETTIQRVQQVDAMGCGIACLAMLSGCSYEDVKATLPEEFNFTSGLTDHTILWWLNAKGFWNRRCYGGTPRFIEAVRAPITGLALTQDRHWVVFARGSILDPARPDPLPYYDLRQIIEVLPPWSNSHVR